jgi:hypothetical protein
LPFVSLFSCDHANPKGMGSRNENPAQKYSGQRCNTEFSILQLKGSKSNLTSFKEPKKVCTVLKVLFSLWIAWSLNHFKYKIRSYLLHQRPLTYICHMKKTEISSLTIWSPSYKFCGWPIVCHRVGKWEKWVLTSSNISPSPNCLIKLLVHLITLL